jgi:hypothetical protein
MDIVVIGLPDEFADSVLTGAVQAPATRLLGPGVLRFDCAAQGLVGSSRWFFRHLSTIVVRLLTSRVWSEEELAAILETFGREPT